MSELTNNCDNHATIRWKLLVSASALALTAAILSLGIARAEDTDHPLVWIELGGQYSQLDDGQQRYAPPFVSVLPDSLPSPLPAQRLPAASFDWNGQVSFEPTAADWIFSASVRYGRSASTGRVEKVLPPIQIQTYGFALDQVYVESRSYEHETHAILDFTVGKDVGLGMSGTSVLSGGVRVAQFSSGQTASITAFPSFQYQHSHNRFEGQMEARRGFDGIGPSIAWAASTPVAGSAKDGEITFDWGANAALLFGRRKADIHHQTSQCFGLYRRQYCIGVYTHAGEFKRSHMATIPNLGGFAGLSMRYADAKISLGYRGDFFFNAMDVGINVRQSQTLGFYGPFAAISIGIGG